VPSSNAVAVNVAVVSFTCTTSSIYQAYPVVALTSASPAVAFAVNVIAVVFVIVSGRSPNVTTGGFVIVISQQVENLHRHHL